MFQKVKKRSLSVFIPVGLLLTAAIVLLVNAKTLKTEPEESPVDSTIIDSTAVFASSCAECHMNEGLQMAYRGPNGSVHHLYFSPEGYRKSIHFRNGKILCSDCHEGDYSTFPHPGGNELPRCLDCHKDIRDEYLEIEKSARASVHFTSDRFSFTCGTCHAPHTMVPAREMTIQQKNAACVECHEHEYNPSGLTLRQRHNWHPQAALHLDRISCVSCHTQPSGDDYSFRHRIGRKETATSDCYTCHGPNSKMVDYLGGFDHGVPMKYSSMDLIKFYYISGATREPWLDYGGIALVLLTFIGVVVHGLLRYRFARKEGK